MPADVIEAEAKRQVADLVTTYLDKERVDEFAQAKVDAAVARADLDRQVEDDLTSIRTAATGWLTAVTTVIGLFGVASVAFAGDATANLSTTDEEGGWVFSLRLTFVLLAIAAAAAAFGAVAAGTFSAHGWPKVRWKKANRTDDQSQLDRREALAKAIVGLIISVSLAAASGAFFLAAAILVWWNAVPGGG